MPFCSFSFIPPHPFTSICSKTLQLFNLHTEHTTHHTVSRYLFKWMRHCQRRGEEQAFALPVWCVWYVQCVCVCVCTRCVYVSLTQIKWTKQTFKWPHLHRNTSPSFKPWIFDYLPIYPLRLCGKCWRWKVGGGERKTEWVMVKVTDRKSSLFKPTLLRQKERLLPNSLLYHEITGSNCSASSKCLMSDYMSPANLLPEGLQCFDRSGNHVNTMKKHPERESTLAQSLNPRDLRPCDLGWKSFDRSGIRCRAEKNSLLI